jgi:hypothetical protein
MKLVLVALVAARLVEADARTSTAFGADVRDFRVMLLAARLLAISPFGRKMLLVNKDGSTTYDADLHRMDLTAALGVARVS